MDLAAALAAASGASKRDLKHTIKHSIKYKEVELLDLKFEFTAPSDRSGHKISSMKRQM